MNEPTQEQIIKEFLSRIDDDTGTVKRYGESISNEPLWQVIKEERE